MKKFKEVLIQLRSTAQEQDKVWYLGHVVSNAGVATDPRKGAEV